MDIDVSGPKALQDIRLMRLLEAERRQYQDIVASIPVGLVVLGPDLRILSANGEARRLLGSKTPFALPHALQDKARQTLAAGTPHTNVPLDETLRVSLRRLPPSEARPDVEVLIVIEENGGTTKTGNGHDEPEIPARELLDHVDATVWALDLDTKQFLFVSEKAQELLGYPVEKWIEEENFWSDRIHPEDRGWVLQAYEGSVRSWSRHSCEFRAVSSYGKIVWLRETARLLQLLGGQTRYLIGFTVDVTERRLLDAQLAQSQRQEAIGLLAHRAGGEIERQLQVLLAGDPQQSAIAVQRLRLLATQLNSVGIKDEGGLIGLDVVERLKRLTPTLNAVLGKPERLLLRLFPGAIGVQANPALLDELLTTLVKQAGRRAGSGPVRLDCGRMEVSELVAAPRSSLKPGVYAVITIEDVGATLDAPTRSSLFEGFIGADADLAQAYSRIRSWGGDIAVAPKYPQGTTIQVFLPRDSEAIQVPEPTAPLESPQPVRPSAEPPPQEAEPRRQPAQGTSARQILVVEDEPGIRKLVYRMLKRQSYEVLEAVDLATATQVCDRNPNRIDLLIADVMMTEMASEETIARLRQNCPSMRVLYLSSDTSEEDAKLRDLPEGAASLQKPFTLGSLLTKVGQLLDCQTVSGVNISN